MNNKRIAWIDISKGIGIIIVVLGHAILGSKNFFPKELSKTYYFMFNFIWNFHMPLFFFISGIFLNKWLAKPFKKALFSKAAALLYPYFVWSLILGMTYLVLDRFFPMGSSMNNNITFHQFILFPIVPILNLWFLQTLFCAHITYICLNRMLKINVYHGLIIFTLLYILAYKNIISISYPLGLFTALFFISLGAIFYEKINDYRFDKISKLLVIAIICLFLTLNSVFSYNNIKIIGIEKIIAILGIFSTIFFSIYISRFKFSEGLVFVGKMSMIIYLLHVFFTPATRIIIAKLFGAGNLWFLILVPTIVGVIVPIILYNLFDKMKITKYLFGR